MHLHDPKGVDVDLHYEVLAVDAIKRWAVISSDVPGLVLESVASRNSPSRSRT